MDRDTRLVRALMNHTKNPQVRPLTVFAAKWLIFIFVPLVVVSDLVLCGGVPRAITWNAGWTLAIALILSLTLGTIFYRGRPYVEHVFIRARIRPPVTIHSFPSSHAAAAFALATSLGYTHAGLGLFALLLAVLIGLGRIAVGVHYVTDILAGAGLGIFIAAVYHTFGNSLISCVA